MLVEKMKASRNALILISGLMVNVASAIVLYFGLFGHWTLENIAVRFNLMSHGQANVFFYELGEFLGCNIFTLLSVCSMLVVLVAAYVHIILWPILGRCIYAAADQRIFTDRRLLGGAGSALLIYGLPGIAPVLKIFR
jgi:hypothetical protein